MTTNAELAERYRAVLPDYTKPFYDAPISIDRGEGSWVWDLEDNKYMDWFGGILTTMVGHAQPDVVAAVQAQAAKVMHTSSLYLSEPMIELAEEVAAVSGIPDARVFFTTSGSEANDMAILLATAYRKSNEILAMRTATTAGRSPLRRSRRTGRGRRPRSRVCPSTLCTAPTSFAARSASSTTRRSPRPASATSCRFLT